MTPTIVPTQSAMTAWLVQIAVTSLALRKPCDAAALELVMREAMTTAAEEPAKACFPRVNAHRSLRIGQVLHLE